MAKTVSFEAAIQRAVGDAFDVSVEHVSGVSLSMRKPATSQKHVTAVVEALDNLRRADLTDHISKISITGKGFYELPSAILGFVQLKELSITHTRIEHLPDALFSKLRDLAHVDIRWNELTSLPESLGNLGELSTLKAYGNADGMEVPYKALHRPLYRHLVLVEIDESAKLFSLEAQQFNRETVQEGGTLFFRLVPKAMTMP